MSEKVHATQDWVKEQIGSLVDSAPEALNTLKELSEALGNDENFAATMLKELDIIENTLEQHISYASDQRGNLDELTTTDNLSLVAAINEINQNKSDKIPNVISTMESEELTPNYHYMFYDISSLTVTLPSHPITYLYEFMFSFETPETVDNSFLQIISDEEIKWIKEPNLKPDYVYEVSVVNGVGVIAGTAKEVTE